MTKSDPRLKNVCRHGTTTYYGVSCGITARPCVGHCEQVRLRKVVKFAFYKHIVGYELLATGEKSGTPIWEMCPLLKEVLESGNDK